MHGRAFDSLPRRQGNILFGGGNSILVDERIPVHHDYREQCNRPPCLCTAEVGKRGKCIAADRSLSGITLLREIGVFRQLGPGDPSQPMTVP